MSYEMVQMLPPSDSTSVAYREFKQMFGEDGSVLFIGIQDTNVYKLDEFNAWYGLTEKIGTINGVEGVVSFSKLYYLSKNDSTKKFDFLPVFQGRPDTQEELDSLIEKVYSLPLLAMILQ
ncbi:MAG: hypothetical protein B6I19_03305 [Bacteroidetes bacterium 4572_114]|nr:MAG: hypothetical protein B6I19_03305 [Bacteroidetes bacterium 4572_114]